MQLTPLNCLHAHREYILLKLINKEWAGFTHTICMLNNSNIIFKTSLISYTCHIKTLYIKIGYSE